MSYKICRSLKLVQLYFLQHRGFSMSYSLKDKVVFITGASSGFGADAARLFAKEGCIVILAARRMDRLTALAEEIRLAGGQALAVPLDVTEQSQIDDAVKTVLDNIWPDRHPDKQRRGGPPGLA